MSDERIWVDGYVRVSKVGRRRGERFISPAVQREVINGWALARGARVLEVFEELDESGSRDDRPLMEKAVQRVESGISQGIVVSKVDRFGRSLIAGLAAIKRVTVAGGTFVAVQNGLDTGTESGRLVLSILLSVAEWESDRVATSWDQAIAKAVQRGVYTGPGAPVGYRRTRAGHLRPDPETAPMVAAVYRRRADGENLASLAKWLEEQGVKTAQGNVGWTVNSLSFLLRRRVYLGELSRSGHVNDCAHQALIDAATWQAAQRPRRAVLTHQREPALLARLVRCAGCRMTMSARWSWKGPRGIEVVYSCPRHSAAGRCAAPATIDATYLEAYVEECFFELLRHRAAKPAKDMLAAEEALESASTALARYRDSDRVLRTLGEDSYIAGLAARSKRIRDARLRLAGLRDAHFIYTLPPVPELERQWLAMDDHQRRKLIAQAFDCVFVAAGHLHLEDRVTICRAGTAPQTPRIGTSGNVSPFAAQARHRLPAPKPWPTSRIERELADYLHCKHVWPTADQFVAAGRRRLYDQIVRHAGVACWAHHFALPILFDHRSREPWTDDRVRIARELYLRRKRRFPSQAEFEVDGLDCLRRVVSATGGVQRWSRELAVPLEPRQRQRRSYSRA